MCTGSKLVVRGTDSIQIVVTIGGRAIGGQTLDATVCIDSSKSRTYCEL